MNARTLRREIAEAQKRIGIYISANINRDILHSRGLAREGWHGGYSEALSDVLLCLNGVYKEIDQERSWGAKT